MAVVGAVIPPVVAQRVIIHVVPPLFADPPLPAGALFYEIRMMNQILVRSLHVHQLLPGTPMVELADQFMFK
jgi:hypothetical protein